MSVNKILVYVRKCPSSIPVRGSFADCIVDLVSNGDSFDTLVSCELVDDKLILSPSKQPTSLSTNNATAKPQPALKGYLLTHPSFCPVHHLTPRHVAALPTSVSGRGVDVGVVTVLESSDKRVLLTRRAKHMRTFPGLWVPPGGHIEAGEGLLEAALRELGEETGLRVRVGGWQVLCLWESVFPHSLSLGQPKRHHVVVYLHVTVEESSASMDERICLDKTEVDGCVWIDETIVNAMQNSDIQLEDKYIGIKTLDKGGVMVESSMATSVFTATAPTLGQDIERISTGTKYACIQWNNYCKQNTQK